MTFFYTNAQSARMQFYHDHARGITRLNVYAGEAAGYVITDAVERDMINGTNFSNVNINCTDTDLSGVAGDFPGECARVLPDIGIPLVIQDRTFVDAATVYAQDPTWASGTAAPGTAITGDLWYPHVYMTVTNPWDPTGTNAFGRWFYGPWFNPPTPVCINGQPVGCIENGPVANPYYGPINAPWEPPLNPGVPNPSAPGESFMDTPIVNATAYPVLQVEPKAYRFRILNAANDRALNLQPAVSIPFEMKAMHDEMGGVYDTMYGRMSGMLGLTNPTSAQGFIIPYPYLSPPTDVVKGSTDATKIGDLPDGTQIWRIFHIGVDTHPIHTHLFTAQVIARVGQDGQVSPRPFPSGQAVDAQNMGWKDTVYINPLEITFLALRPTVPTPAELPFELPNSVRLIDPTLPEGATLPPPGPAGWFDPQGNPITEILNHYVNFGWEYVWHCHILSHQEMDFMHAVVFADPPLAPTGLTDAWNGNNNNPKITLNWVDQSSYEAGFTIQRAFDANFTSGLVTLTKLPAVAGKGTTVTYTDTTPARNSAYFYRVLANGEVVGDTTLAGFPTMSADSFSNTAGPVNTYATATAPAAPTNLTATAQAGPQVSLTLRDNANNETGFIVNRCSFVAPATTCNNFAQIATVGSRNNTGNVTYVDTTVAWGTSYLYQVAAFNGQATSAYVTLGAAVALPAIPVAPTRFTVTLGAKKGNNYPATLQWNWPDANNLTNPTSFTIERANNLDFTTGLTTITAAGTDRSLTQNLSRNTVYYFRIKANNSLGGSSAGTNAQPFPIRTGP